MLEEEVHGPVDGERHGAVDLDLVEDVGAARAAQAPALHPGRGQETGGVGAGGEDARVGGDDLAALGDDEPEGEEVVGVGGSAAQLGQDGEIDVVQGRARLGQVLEGDAAGVALELGDERRVGPAGGGTQAHVDAGLGSLARHAVGAARAQRHVDDEHGPAVERDEVDFDVVAEKVKNKLGIEKVYTNSFTVEDGKLTGEVTGPLVSGSKLDILKDYVEDAGITLDEVVAVGDGANDISMIESAGYGIAFNAKDSVKEIADIVVDEKDLTKVLDEILNQLTTEKDIVTVEKEKTKDKKSKMSTLTGTNNNAI